MMIRKINVKKETIKEIGKLFLDTFKIVFAIAFITPIVKGEDVNMFIVFTVFIPLIFGIYFTNQGAKDE